MECEGWIQEVVIARKLHSTGSNPCPPHDFPWLYKPLNTELWLFISLYHETVAPNPAALSVQPGWGPLFHEECSYIETCQLKMQLEHRAAGVE